MKLIELEPFFIRYETRVESYEVVSGDPDTWNQRGRPVIVTTGPRQYSHVVDSMNQAQGIRFYCPKCRNLLCEVTFANRGVSDSQGTHNSKGEPSRWDVSGNDFSNLTVRPSILIEEASCGWHGYITDGKGT